jgi:hypothetical protein
MEIQKLLFKAFWATTKTTCNMENLEPIFAALNTERKVCPGLGEALQ